MAFFSPASLLCGGGRSFGCPRLNVSHWTSSWRYRVLAMFPRFCVSPFPRIWPNGDPHVSNSSNVEKKRWASCASRFGPKLVTETFSGQNSGETGQEIPDCGLEGTTAATGEKGDCAWLKQHWWFLMLEFFGYFLLSLFRCATCWEFSRSLAEIPQKEMVFYARVTISTLEGSKVAT